MESRTGKYYTDNNTNSRSSKNARLYREVYGKYDDLNNLPMTDNTDEIDMDRLKEMVSNMNKNNTNTSDESSNLNILETKKRNIDKQKIYDINKILEKAKYENSKLKEPTSNLTKTSRDILSTLNNGELNTNQISSKYYPKDQEEDKINDNLSMTREMKYHTRKISTDPLIEQVMPDNNLSFELLSDLKPTGNTIVTEPIKSDNNIKSQDTSDIDIIKPDNEIDNDFFTSSYKFSNNDFTDNDFIEESNKGNILKIILLILAIIVFAGVIYYFIKNYGIGI